MYMYVHICTLFVLTARLRALQERDEEKVANEKAKSNLESYIFETQEWLEVDEVIAVSTEEQREEIRTSVREVSDWFEEEGYYNAETSVSSAKYIVFDAAIYMALVFRTQMSS